jgi:16S rRNA pseudouridine516 synthase
MGSRLRLDKYISNATDLSRTEAKRLIKAGDVSIDEHIATSGSQKVTSDDSVTIDGSPIKLLVDRYFMMNLLG